MNRQEHRGPGRHFNYSNVMSTVAVFLVIAGGSAVAATSGGPGATVSGVKQKLKKVTGQVADLQGLVSQLQGQIVELQGEQGGGRSPSGPAGGDLTGNYPNPSLEPSSVGTGEIADNAVNAAKVLDDSLTGGDVANRSLSGTEVAFGSLGGPEIDEGTLGQVPSALLGGFGRSGAVTTCDPESGAFAFCAGTEILNVPPGARALVFGRGLARTDSGNDSSRGNCRLSTSSIGTIPNTQRFLAAWPGPFESFTLVGVTPPLPAGSTSFGIECNEDNSFFSGQKYDEISASVVLISGN